MLSYLGDSSALVGMTSFSLGDHNKIKKELAHFLSQLLLYFNKL